MRSRQRSNAEGSKEGEVCFAKWIGMEHAEEIFEEMHKGTFDIFFRVEHRMKKAEMEGQFFLLEKTTKG